MTQSTDTIGLTGMMSTLIKIIGHFHSQGN